MKILHVAKYYSPVPGGIESVNKLIVDNLKEDIHHVFCFNQSCRTVYERKGNVEITRVATLGVVASQPLSIVYPLLLRKTLKHFKPDVVHFHYPNPLGAFFLNSVLPKNIKLIVHWHSDIVAQHRLHKLVGGIERHLLKRADIILATSPNYAKCSIPLSPFFKKIRILPCAITPTDFDLSTADEEQVQKLRTVYGNKPVILFLGRHVEYKGIEYLLQAEKYIKSDCEFVIVGSGPLTEGLKARYTSPRIHWIGQIKDEEKKICYALANIFVFPSITRNEAFGVVLLEAMYCLCPVVDYTIIGSGVNWVAKNGETCIECENRSVTQFAEAIDYLLMNPSLRHIMGENAHNRVLKNFTSERVITYLKGLYQELIMGVI